MATYTVHEPPAPEADRVDRATELEFIKDGFSWLTAILPPFGLLSRRLWLATLGYFAAVGLVTWGLTKLKLDPAWITLFVGMIGIYLGFEVSTLKRWSLERAGWRTLGVVNGKSIGECERRFLESWLPGQPVINGGGSGTRSGTLTRESAAPTGLGRWLRPWAKT